MRLITFCFVSTLCLAGVQQPVGAADRLSVSMSSSSTFNATALIASGAKIFEEKDLDVSFIDVGGGTNVVASVIGGSADIGILGVGNLVQARSRGQDVKAFASATRGFPNYIIVTNAFLEKSGVALNAPLKDRVAALKGKTLAVNDIGGSAGDFARDLLQRSGMQDDDITMINMPSGAARLAALRAGRVDAAIAYSPEPETATAEGIGKVYINTLIDIPETKNVEYLLYVARADFIGANRDKIKRFAQAVDAASAVVEKDPAKSKQLFWAQVAARSKASPLSPETQNLVWEAMLRYIARPATLSASALQGSREYFKIPDAITTADLTDTTILPAKPAN